MTTEPLADREAEACLLGALMLAPPDLLEVCYGLDRRDFHRSAHGDTLDAVKAVAATGRRPDLRLVSDELDRRGHHDPPRGELADMTARVASAVNADRYAAHVKALARRRRIRDSCLAAARDVADPSVDVDQRVQGHVDTLVADRDASGLIHPTDVAESVLALHDEGRDARSIPTGWRPLDRIWRLAPGMLTILAGHPGHGKSAWLDALATRLAATQDWRTCLFAPESSPTDDHAARMTQAWTGVGFHRMTASQVTKALADLDDRVVWVDHDAHTTVAGILAQASVAHAQAPLDMLVVDPWSEVEAVPERGQREDMLIGAELTRMRRWARLHQVHVVVAVHPRQVDRNSDGTLPVPHSQILHGGAVWRRKADSLLAIWRDEAGSDPTLAEVHVQKVRRNGVDGQMGSKCQLRQQQDTGRYEPASHLEAV